VAGLRHPYSHKAKKAEMKAAETNKKQAASQAMALRKMIATTQEGAKASWAHVAPAVQALYTSKLAEAESLVSKVEASPRSSRLRRRTRRTTTSVAAWQAQPQSAASPQGESPQNGNS